jgi:hypothetical protein
MSDVICVLGWDTTARRDNPASLRHGMGPGMNPFWAFMLRLSGSVKWRCARSWGVPGGCFAGRPRRGRSDRCSACRFLFLASSCAAASQAAFASRILSTRGGGLHPAVTHRRMLGGIGSDRRPLQCAMGPCLPSPPVGTSLSTGVNRHHSADRCLSERP